MARTAVDVIDGDGPAWGLSVDRLCFTGQPRHSCSLGRRLVFARAAPEALERWAKAERVKNRAAASVHNLGSGPASTNERARPRLPTARPPIGLTL